MTLPFVIDNNEHRLSAVLNDLLPKTEDRPFDVATAYFAVSEDRAGLATAFGQPGSTGCRSIYKPIVH